MTNRSLSALAVALLCLATAASCRGGPTSAAANCDAPGVTRNEVRVGLIYPDSGVFARTFTPTRAGIDARFGAVNAAGGVNGRKITYDWEDDQGRLDTNGVVARDLIETKNVFAIMEASPVSTGSADYLANLNVPVTGLAAEPVWSQHRNMFTVQYTSNAVDPRQSVTTFGKFIREQGGTQALIVLDPAGLALSTTIAKQVQASLRSADIPFTTVEADETPTASQLDRIAQKLLSGGINTLVSTMTIEGFTQIVAGAHQRGARPKVILSGSQTVNDNLLRTYGAQLAGLTTYAARSVDPRDPAVAAYQANLTRYSPELQAQGDTLARIGYMTADMIVRGLREAGPCPTRASFVSGLRAVKGYTAEGLTPAVDFEQDFGKLTVCYPFIRVNAAGTGVETISDNYCGERITS
ncbi:ABC transporter substrate-binding protein [Frankia sp. AgPm24]|uniref:ABC transporter substrate-binding protein n=1 Tax=Frankia sp. AgPm24 TaxID=631128 RepID=UPI00200ED151|nr:ABC transporter substrate-binding protein [Frankia sp. AgPm24]MCK9920642.1 ABC transporter substrate-binding protein [Frankia sp. AgPm24]